MTTTTIDRPTPIAPHAVVRLLTAFLIAIALVGGAFVAGRVSAPTKEQRVNVPVASDGPSYACPRMSGAC